MKIREQLKKFYNEVFDYIFPSKCNLCSKIVYSRPTLCSGCSERHFQFHKSRIAGVDLYSNIKYNSSTKRYYISLKTSQSSFPVKEFEVFVNNFSDRISPDHVIVPVPSNSSDLPLRLAGMISEFSGGQVRELLILKNPKKAQKDIRRNERVKNVRNAFGIDKTRIFCYNSSRKPEVIIVDDMKTTGATLREVSRIMKKAELKVGFMVTLAYRED